MEVSASTVKELRERTGAGYQALQFHDQVMKYGGLPVSLARWGMGLAE
jgi:hypothetical protein